jgi:hypothetical protein
MIRYSIEQLLFANDSKGKEISKIHPILLDALNPWIN